MNKDLTVGNPEKVLWQFCLPLFASVLFQQLYNVADSLVAGKFIGEAALAAVGNSYEICMIFLAFAFGCNIGTSVIVSQLFGGKQYRSLKTAVSTAMIASGVLCLILMIAGYFCGAPLLRLIHTPEDILPDSLLYLNIYILGLPFIFFYNISNGIFSALGDSRTPFLFLACSSIANIGADILFVTVFHLGIAGVALATFLCQGASCVLAVVVVLRRMRGIPHDGRPEIFSFFMLRRLSVIAIPSILQQSFVSVGNIMVQGVINPLGSGAIAGYSAAVKLNTLAVSSFAAIGNGVSNFTAQNYGAGLPQRMRQGYRSAVKMVWVIAVAYTLLLFLAARPLVLLFMNEPTETAVQTGILFLRILSPFYVFVSLKIVSDGSLRGAGLMTRFMITTFSDLVLRVALSVLFSRLFPSPFGIGIWCSWPIGWIISTGISVAFYFASPWRKKLSAGRPETRNS